MWALACALALPPPRPSSARQEEGRGLSAVRIRVEDGKELRLYERSYALVIGVSDYAQWPKLPGVKNDIEAVARALERHGFLVTKVENPDSAQLDKVFRSFIDTYGLGVENRLLFYFAGHGHTVRQSYGEEMGYIVPADAPLPARDPAGFRSKAMDMQQMELYARRIQSKHALFLFDSCFSGAIFAPSRAVPDSIGYKTARPVRQFITSGSADEQVPDESIFRRQLVEALDGEADANHDGYVTGTELGEFLQDKVINYSRNAQHPQYGKIRNPHLDKGDFVFALPKAPRPAPTPRPAPGLLASPGRAGDGAADAAGVEIAFWESVKSSSDPEDFQAYLTKYPAGQFASLARRRLASLKSAPAARPAPPKPGAVIRNRLGIELVYVPPGSFMRGSENGAADERPVRRVTIREGFYMGKYEVTQAQWEAQFGDNPSRFKGCADCPVDSVTWADAMKFVAALNGQNDGFVYRLPTEAEWEYACRAGTTDDWAGDPDAMGWYANNSGRERLNAAELWRTDKANYDRRLTANGNRTHPAGRKLPNAFGLYDMHGNVAEWCQDWYHDGYAAAPDDGSAWLSTRPGQRELRVLRGGSWDNLAFYMRSARRDADEPGIRGSIIGFRVVAVDRVSTQR